MKTQKLLKWQLIIGSNYHDIYRGQLSDIIDFIELYKNCYKNTVPESFVNQN